MKDIEAFEEENDLDEILQEVADSSRLLKIGLRNHDPEMLADAIARIKKRYGEQGAQDWVCTTITMLMSEEGWSFEMENGESSPLL